MTVKGHNNEIDLRTLILILRQHFKLLVVVTVIVTLLGSIWALTRPQQYRYRQTIRLMHYYANGKLQVVQPTSVIKQLIENVYLPAFQQQYNQQHPKANISLSTGKGGNYQITASVSVDSSNTNGSIQDNGILFLSVVGEHGIKNIVTAANKYIFKQIMQEQEQRGSELFKNMKAQINILSKQLLKLEKLQKEKSNYLIGMQNGMEKFSQQSNIDNILLNIVAQKNQTSLTVLQVKLSNLQHQVASITPVKFGEMIQAVKQPNQLSTQMKVFLSFLVGLFLAIITILFKRMVEV